MNIIDHLIWEHQQHCQISLQLAAEELFNSLDERLSPKVFLIGILIKPDKDRPSIILECPDDDYNVKDFIAVKALSIQHNFQIEQEKRPTYTDDMGYLNATYTTEVQKTLRTHVNGRITRISFLSRCTLKVTWFMW